MDHTRDDDPFDWSVDQVVQYLCYNPNPPWTLSKNPSPMPEREPFESALREHGITGEVLLNGNLETFFRSGLQLHEGPYYTVDRAIQYARRNSARYQEITRQERLYQAAAMTPLMDHNMSSPFMPSQRINFNPVTALPVESRSAFENRSVESPAEANGLVNDSHSYTGIRTTYSSPSHVSREAPRVESSRLPNASQRESIAPRAAPRVRENEHIYVDEQGRKRRKLDLDIKEAPREALATIQPEDSRTWYIGPQKHDPASIFYPIQTDTDDDNWSLLASNCSTGQRLFVKRKLFDFFRKPVTILPSRDGLRRTAVFPYDNQKADTGKPRFFTLYTSREGKVAVAMKSTADNDVDLQQPADLKTNNKERDQYSYLLQKYPVDDDDADAYPVFGESGSEGGYDTDTWLEMNKEQGELALRAQTQPKQLTPQVIDAVIDEYIKVYQETWKVKRLPKLEFAAHNLWLNAFRNKCRNTLVKVSLNEIDRLVLRLEKIKKELHGHEWTQRSHLSDQCQSMEQTVFAIESQKWRVSILESSQCPPKVHLPLIARSKKDVVRPQPDEESLDSDSSDGLGGFIVDDMTARTHDTDKHQLLTQDWSGEDSLPVPPPMAAPSIHPFEPNPEKMSPSETPQNVDRDNRSDNLLKKKPRCGFYVSSGDESDSNMETPRSTVKVAGQDVEVIDLTTSPVEADFTSAEPQLLNQTREKNSLPRLKFDSPSTRELNQEPLPTVTNTSRYQKEKFEPPAHSDEDRTELLKMMINLIPRSERTKLIDTCLSYRPKRFRYLVKEGIRSLFKGRENIHGLYGERSYLILRATVFYVAWVNCQQLNSSGIRKGLVIAASLAIKRDDSRRDATFHKFCEQLFELLRPYQTKKEELSAITTSGESDDDQRIPSSKSPHNKRKRLVKENQAVKSGQAAAKQRVELQEQQRKKLEERLERVGLSNRDSGHQPVSFEQPTIFLHPHIGSRVKPHQLAGIQFMWRELIQSEKRDGCLLAHTMGLGKTMQVIALLVTIAATASSSDSAFSRQVPKWFHRSQTLVLCPSSLIENWYEEFLMWTPKEHKLGPIRKVVAADALESRLSTVQAWNSEGGILILSYSLFRMWVDPPKPRKAQNSTADAQAFGQDTSKLREQLLRGPRIVVADEAHQMKNKDSMLSKAAAMIESRSRIALTGSPLANNLMDYYAMVNWISPNYLDDLTVFRAKYLEPIEEGLFFDSTYQEQRRSLKKLQVLKEILNPKISRADISVLEGSLPKKVEFVITVPLTDAQKEAYNGYARMLLAEKSATSPNTTTILSWLAVLGLCCNHPACFYNKLEKRAEEPPSKTLADDIDRELSPLAEASPAEASLGSLGFNDAMLATQREILSQYADLQDPKYSYRAQIFQTIVEESVRIGDKLLCFSHSIPTLDYLESLLRMSGVRFSRLDGRTAVKTRQAAIKAFNTDPDIKVYLISTRAGGLGLNITGANRVIIFDFGFNPTWEEQAVARAYRLGQDKPVYIYRFLAGGTFEQIIHNKSIFKTQLAMRVVDKKNVERSASKSLGDYLFPVKDVERADFSEYIGKDREVLDKILHDEKRSAAILNIGLTETFCREDDEKLTEDEKKEIQEELELELLRQSDPAAYEKKMAEKTLSMGTTMPIPFYNNIVPQAGLFKEGISTAAVNTEFRKLNNIHPSLPPASSSGNIPRSFFTPAVSVANKLTEALGITLVNTGPPPIRPAVVPTSTSTLPPPTESPAAAFSSITNMGSNRGSSSSGITQKKNVSSSSLTDADTAVGQTSVAEPETTSTITNS